MGFFRDFLRPLSKPARKVVNPPPQVLVDQAQALAKSVDTPEDARRALADLTPHLQSYTPTADLFLPCATLLEKTRQVDGMLENWTEVHNRFPEEALPIRMMMRWYRRLSQVDEGLQRLHQIVRDWLDDPTEAEKLILGYQELQAFSNMDFAMGQLVDRHPNNNKLRILFIKSLVKNRRLARAQKIAAGVTDAENLGPGAKQVLADLAQATALMRKSLLDDDSKALAALVGDYAARVPRQRSNGQIGQVVFLTGQLGAGGAERQMTRIAAGMCRAVHEDDGHIGTYKLLASPQVCVRQTNPETGSDFFLPILREAGVPTFVYSKSAVPDEDTLQLDERRASLFALLPKDLRNATLQLYRYFRDINCEVAYLWQDGGVLSAALAACIAEVPLIITSFRGLPPNIRTELLRPELPHLYKALFAVPGVVFTANSQSTATAYEDWLDLPTGSIRVLHNAVPAIMPDGDPEDHDKWARISSASPDCSKTVLGVFRFDHNKRPKAWIRIAAEHCAAHPDTRFVIVGRGVEFEACQHMIEEMELTDRIFLTGPSHKVGFWLHKATMLMHLAQREGLPNVVIEAQLTGIPVLATPAGGTSDIVEHGVTGHLLSDAETLPADEALAQIQQMLKDPEALAKTGAAARKRAEPLFLLDVILDRTAALFSDSGGRAGPNK